MWALQKNQLGVKQAYVGVCFKNVNVNVSSNAHMDVSPNTNVRVYSKMPTCRFRIYQSRRSPKYQVEISPKCQSETFPQMPM